ncbi:hypothetical protein GOV03_03340 [Candidatus Woesearchaeota archaeon]|nr:hypothetical protein [Candidatus Woesearchaeota archaeon]
MSWHDTKKEALTALEVRDALVECFVDAHKKEVMHAQAVSDEKQADEKSRKFVVDLIKKSFTVNGGDFNKPTKEVIIKVMNHLKTFAKNFRDQGTILSNYSKMVSLVKKIKE